MNYVERLNEILFSISEEGKYNHKVVEPKGKFDDDSFRTVPSGKKGTKVVVGCPKGKWDDSAERCKVGTQAHKILEPKSKRKKKSK